MSSFRGGEVSLSPFLLYDAEMLELRRRGKQLGCLFGAGDGDFPSSCASCEVVMKRLVHGLGFGGSGGVAHGIGVVLQQDVWVWGALVRAWWHKGSWWIIRLSLTRCVTWFGLEVT